jgi:hypothetical protein
MGDFEIGKVFLEEDEQGEPSLYINIDPELKIEKYNEDLLVEAAGLILEAVWDLNNINKIKN